MINAESYPEFIGQIVDIFEDYCGSVGLIITNTKRDDEVCDILNNNDNVSPDELDFANIYGDDYDAIANSVDYYVNKSSENKFIIKNKEAAITAAVDAFYIIIKIRGKYSNGDRAIISDDMTKYFHYKIDKLITKWESE